MAKKVGMIPLDTLGDCIVKIYKKYESDKSAKQLIDRFLEIYGKYETVMVFGSFSAGEIGVNLKVGGANVCIRDDSLIISFADNFRLERFLSSYQTFIADCKESFKVFECRGEDERRKDDRREDDRREDDRREDDRREDERFKLTHLDSMEIAERQAYVKSVTEAKDACLSLANEKKLIKTRVYNGNRWI